MNFEELGAVFRQEREKRGLSIKEVMEVTKISRRNIIAIEEGDSGDLPHPVYAKGFIRSYARFLGLDGDEMARVFDAELDQEEDLDITQYDVTPGADLAFQEADSHSGSKNPIPAILTIIVLLGILGGLVYYFAFHDKTASDVSEAPVVQEQNLEMEQEVPQQAMTEEAAVKTPAEDESATSEEQQTAEAAAPAEEQRGGEDATTEGSVKPAPVQPAAEQVTEKKETYKHVLVIRATSDEGCWVGVWKDDEQNMARDFFLRRGEPLRLKFNSYRRIRIGNVPGVSILYNDEKFPIDESKGKTQDIRFGNS